MTNQPQTNSQERNPNVNYATYPPAVLDTKFKTAKSSWYSGNPKDTENPCPTCGAEIGYDCYSRNGKRLAFNGRSTPHAARNKE